MRGTDTPLMRSVIVSMFFSPFYVLFVPIQELSSYISFYGYSLAICLFFVNQQSQQKSDFKFVMFFDLFGKHFVGNKKRASIKKIEDLFIPLYFLWLYEFKVIQSHKLFYLLLCLSQTLTNLYSLFICIAENRNRNT